MTVKGRTTEHWGRDRSARWDPGETNRWRSYPSTTQHAEVVPAATQRVELPGRPGYTERALIVEEFNAGLIITLTGWYPDSVNLNPRQVAFLRDTLNQWFPPETTD